MKIGVCGWINRVEASAKAGFDYMEPAFRTLAICDDNEYNTFREKLEKYDISCEVANCFLPGDMKIVGQGVDYDSIKSYLKAGFKRADELGIKVIVMGSGAARNIPEGYTYKSAINDIIRLVSSYASPMAGEYGIDFVFEPLCKRESNIINTVKEGAMLASAINRDNVGVLGDLYHMYVEGDTYDDIRELKGILRHAHISNPIPDRTDMKRIYMRDPDEYDYKGFFDALKYAGCERISIEADTKDFEADIAGAFSVMNMFK